MQVVLAAEFCVSHCIVPLGVSVFVFYPTLRLPQRTTCAVYLFTISSKEISCQDFVVVEPDDIESVGYYFSYCKQACPHLH